MVRVSYIGEAKMLEQKENNQCAKHKKKEKYVQELRSIFR